MGGGTPSLIPPVGIAGPMTNAFIKSSCPASSTQVNASQYACPASNSNIVEFPLSSSISTYSVEATAFVIAWE
ncbi:MAG: Uncharacterised protein [Methanobacteriota archaeon]|nr:MAG: Uncharacterised protein [Euryarchaeota archaeon]